MNLFSEMRKGREKGLFSKKKKNDSHLSKSVKFLHLFYDDENE